MKIRTENVNPPIPIRSCDWSAVDDDTYDGPGSPIGRGATEAEAIADLKQQLGIGLGVWAGTPEQSGRRISSRNLAAPSLRLEVLQQRLTCTSLVPGRKDRWEPCDRPTEHECVCCHDGICLLCNLNCFTCGEPLHDACREDHEQEAGHAVDQPPKKPSHFVTLAHRRIDLDQMVDRVGVVMEPK